MSSQPVQLIYSDDPGALPAVYTLPPGLNLELSSVVARINGSGAAATFVPVLEVLSQDDKLMARVRCDQEFAAGDTGVVTWAPFLRRRGGSSAVPLVEINSASLLDNGGTLLNGVLTDMASQWNVYGTQGNPDVIEADSSQNGIVLKATGHIVVVAYIKWSAAFSGERFCQLSIPGGGGSGWQPSDVDVIRSSVTLEGESDVWVFHARVTAAAEQLVTVELQQTSGADRAFDDCEVQITYMEPSLYAP